MKKLFLLFCDLFLKILTCGKQRKNLPEHPKTIFLLMCNWLGDTFWALPVIHEIEKKYPDAVIYAGIKPFSAVLLNGRVPEERRLLLTQVISDRTRESFSLTGWIGDIMRIRKIHADLCFDLMGNSFSALTVFFSGASYISGSDTAGHFARLYDHAVNRNDVRYSYLYLIPCKTVADTLSLPLERTLSPVIPMYSPEEARRRSGLSDQSPVALVIPGAGWKAKEWAPERYHQLAMRLEDIGYQVVVSGSEREEELCRSVADGLKAPHILRNDLPVLISLFSASTLVIGNDSGIVNLAAAAGCRTVDLFCGTNPERIMPPCRNVRRLTSSCPRKPCGGELHCATPPKLVCDCPQNMDLSVDEVFGAVIELCGKESES